MRERLFPYIVVSMTLRELLRFTILACVFVTPFIGLIVAESMFFPFITGKNFTFRILVEVMLGAWALLMLLDSTYRPKFSWILAAAGTFLAVIAVADFTGVNPYKSFWSNYERMEGLITLAHLFLYFIIAGTVVRAEEVWKWLWRTSLAVSFYVAGYAFSQKFGDTAIHQSATRLDATFGNAAYLGIYALFHIFLAVFLYARSKRESGLHFIYPIIAGANLFTLYFTQTRGSMLGLLGGMFLVALLVAVFERERPSLRKWAIGGIVGVVALVGLFITFKDTSFIQSSETLRRMASISLSDTTTKSRFMVWEMSWEGFKERPILGWGQENFLYVFAKHYNPGMYAQEPWFDRSHNVFLDWMIAGGILGILSYLSMFAALLYYLWFTKRHGFSVLEKSLLTGMLGGYFIHNIFVFDNLTSYIVFFTILAYVHAHVSAATEAEAKEARKKKGEELETGDIAVASVVIVALTIAMIYFVNIRNINANLALISAIRPETVLVDDDKGGKRIAMEDVLALGLFGSDEAREQLVQFAVQTLDPRIPAEVRQQFYDLTAREFDAEMASDPLNVRTLSFAASFYARFGQYDRALPLFEKAIELSPGRQSTYLDLAMMLVSLQRFAEAQEIAKTAYELEKANTQAGITYVMTLIYNNQTDLAYTIASEIGDAGYDTRIVNAYGNTGNYNKVVQLVNEKVARGLATGRDHFSLAGALYSLGNKEEALLALDRAVALDTSLSAEADNLKKQIEGAE